MTVPLGGTRQARSPDTEAAMIESPTSSSLPDDWRPPEWVDRAACRGRTDLFFAPRAERPPARVRRENAARRVCQSCPVLIECRTHAHTHVEYGLWGGESEDDRSTAGWPVPAPSSRHRPVGDRVAFA